MSKMFNNYVGKASQLFVMSELLMLGWNVAIPEVDRGDDIFVVKDDNGDLRRVQVKTAQSKLTKNGYTTQFLLPRLQIITPVTPVIYFILLVRHQNKWTDLFAINQTSLQEELIDRLISNSSPTINFTISKRNDKITCGKVDFNQFTQLSNVFQEISR